ncbi:uncharacterized protein LOC126738497 isoform X2 [Anthonomus grandis grandis]|uniref:uncharacterized protein LOC126738497 isoform X2 n=1 Tax=Anthonomus grandis grandis TaxID=2921223 RepID=UPI002166B5A9|nr:uncharacterized protein LOC126738497 isoform X2 [Anthonomus grandis grandis]
MRWLWENKHNYKMSGAVYQPTTVQYESNGPPDRWQNRPISYLGSITQTARRPCITCMPSRNVLPLVLITSCIACFSLGLVMLINGAIGYSETSESRGDLYLIVTIFGAFFFALSIFLFLFFMRITRRMCWRTAKDHMGTSGGHQNLTVNPSTDLLVTAQYAPVSEVVYEPSKLEESEQSKLMPLEHKEISNEDADRLVENDPRIVLRPLNAAVNEEA